MPYYTGDYYRGDYYRGDIFKALGKVAKGVLKVGSNLIPGPVGAIAKGLEAIAKPRAPQTAAQRAMERAAPRMLATAGAIPGFPGPGPFDMPRKHRRMNVVNVRALRRAGRRVRGFLKIARRLGALPISPKGKKLFKPRHRKAAK